jgi:hypothetical protein
MIHVRLRPHIHHELQYKFTRTALAEQQRGDFYHSEDVRQGKFSPMNALGNAIIGIIQS